jgi:hypothetical protein
MGDNKDLPLHGDGMSGMGEPGLCNKTQGAWQKGPSSHEGIPETRLD